jgi:hypothetical protein
MWVDINVSEQHVAYIFPEDGGSIFLQNLRIHLQDFMLSELRMPQSEVMATL